MAAVRPSAIALLSLIAAVLGGAVALVLGQAVGLGDSTTKTVVVAGRSAAPTGSAAPAVVAKPLPGNGFAPAGVYAARSSGVVTIFSYFDGVAGGSGGQGSGFVVSQDGLIMTASHVITTAGEGGSLGTASGAKEIFVQFSDGDRVKAEIVGWDLFDDVGVLRVDPAQHSLDPVPLGDSAALVVGQPVAAIGSPFGNTDSLSVGVVSAIHRAIPSLTTKYDLVDAIQTDAPINHGNSGGPLFDARGRVIGINAQIRSSGGSGFEGVGFAVPIDSARRSMEQLLAGGDVRYAYVGIKTQDLTPAVAKKYGYAATRGALIDEVISGSAGDRAGLRAGTRDVQFSGLTVKVGGDAIVAIDGVPVESARDVVRIVSSRLVPGQVAQFAVVRGKKRFDVPVRLDERPAR